MTFHPKSASCGDRKYVVAWVEKFEDQCVGGRLRPFSFSVREELEAIINKQPSL